MVIFHFVPHVSFPTFFHIKPHPKLSSCNQDINGWKSGEIQAQQVTLEAFWLKSRGTKHPTWGSSENHLLTSALKKRIYGYVSSGKLNHQVENQLKKSIHNGIN